MIALQSECLIFQLNNGESIPCSVEMISIEIVGQSDGYGLIDPKMLRHATASVFHYFKTELDRESVTISEFSQALEKALHGLGLTIFPEKPATPPDAIEADLALLAQESADNLELFFFPRLRDTLRTQLSQAPRILRFYGLRGCVKQLAGARRWSSRCAKMEEQIVEYLRQCLTAEPKTSKCALVVE
ncbi:MAG TPA: hypothetical protein VGO57_12260 [Verrucomicrobiae bacterium]|jgi:hypothetical protein